MELENGERSEAAPKLRSRAADHVHSVAKVSGCPLSNLAAHFNQILSQLSYKSVQVKVLLGFSAVIQTVNLNSLNAKGLVDFSAWVQICDSPWSRMEVQEIFVLKPN